MQNRETRCSMDVLPVSYLTTLHRSIRVQSSLRSIGKRDLPGSVDHFLLKKALFDFFLSGSVRKLWFEISWIVSF